MPQSFGNLDAVWGGWRGNYPEYNWKNVNETRFKCKLGLQLYCDWKSRPISSLRLFKSALHLTPRGPFAVCTVACTLPHILVGDSQHQPPRPSHAQEPPRSAWKCSCFAQSEVSKMDLKAELLKSIWYAFTSLDVEKCGKVSKSQLKVSRESM